ncbi:TlpA family protein disulfide reductase [Thiohalobacter thiocyanaticus]|nr:TlpA family protein disulfide reductase [Thiohalobacter thiocyanaticus]
MRRNRTTRPWLAILLLVSLPAAATAAPEGILTLEPRPAPDFEVSDADGSRFSLEAARGNWVFVHFWASWCAPCRREMPSIQRMLEALDGQGPRVVLINTAEDADTIFFFLAEVAPELHSYSDRNGRITEAWQPRGLPATYLVDPQGFIRYQALGGRPWDEPLYLEFLRRPGNHSD